MPDAIRRLVVALALATWSAGCGAGTGVQPPATSGVDAGTPLPDASQAQGDAGSATDAAALPPDASDVQGDAGSATDASAPGDASAPPDAGSVLSITAENASVAFGATPPNTVQLQATVVADPGVDRSVRWALDPTNEGCGQLGASVTVAGLFSAPTSPQTFIGGTCRVIASAAADASKTAVSVVTITEPQATGPVHYVAHGGSDSNPGTVDAPWATIAYAMTQLQPGDTLFIRGAPGGTDTNTACTAEGGQNGACWRETSSTGGSTVGPFWWTRSGRPAGTATAPITVAAHPGELVIIEPSSGVSVVYADANGGPAQCSYLHFKDLIFDGRNLDASLTNTVRIDPAQMDDPPSAFCHHWTFTGGKVRHGRATSGFQIEANFVTLDGMEIYENGSHNGEDWNCPSGEHDHAIYLGGTDMTVRNCDIHDNVQAIQVWRPSLGRLDGSQGDRNLRGNHVFVNNTFTNNYHNPWICTPGWCTDTTVGDLECPNGIGGEIGLYDAVGSGTTIQGNVMHIDDPSKIPYGVSAGGTWNGNPAVDCTVTGNFIWGYRSGMVWSFTGGFGTNVTSPNTNGAP